MLSTDEKNTFSVFITIKNNNVKEEVIRYSASDVSPEDANNLLKLLIESIGLSSNQ